MESKININLQVRDTDTFNFIFVRGFSSITRNIIQLCKVFQEYLIQRSPKKS